VVAVTELTYAGQMVIARIYTSTQIMLLVSVGYLAVVLPVIALGRRLQRTPSARSDAAVAMRGA
jgi:polar amino acid transport system permease protein